MTHAPRPRRPTHEEIIEALTEALGDIRRLASDWHGALTGEARLELHRLADKLAALLERLGRR